MATYDGTCDRERLFESVGAPSNTEGDGTCDRELPTHAEMRAGGRDAEVAFR